MTTTTRTNTAPTAAAAVPAGPAPNGGLRRPPDRPRATWRTNLITLLLACVMEIGGLLDGWAHNNVPDLESVFTPWHAVLYGGFALTAGWIALQVLRNLQHGRRGLAAVPVGYGLGLVGVIGWAVGGALDVGVWHPIFGIEQGIEALISPTHLLLAGSEILMLTCPLRAAWSDPTLAPAPRFGPLFPALASATLAAQVVAFMSMYAIAFLQVFPADQVALGIPSVLITNLLLIGTTLLLLQRWHTPPGSFTLLFGALAISVTSIGGFVTWPTVIPAIVGGVTADLLIQRFQPRSSPTMLRRVAAVTSLTMWSSYMLVVWLAGWLDWSVPLATGVIVLAVGSSFALALLTAPPPAPNPAATSRINPTRSDQDETYRASA